MLCKRVRFTHAPLQYFVDRKEAKEKPKKSVAPAAAAAGLEPVGDDAQ